MMAEVGLMEEAEGLEPKVPINVIKVEALPEIKEELEAENCQGVAEENGPNDAAAAAHEVKCDPSVKIEVEADDCKVHEDDIQIKEEFSSVLANLSDADSEDVESTSSNGSQGHPRMKKYACKFCVLSFEERTTRTNHLKLHGEEKVTYTCSVCSKSFSMESVLIEHSHLGKANVSSHEECRSGMQSHICVRCGKTFAQQDILPSNECDECGSTVAKQCLLDSYLRSRSWLKCFCCGKIFDGQQCLLVHVNTQCQVLREIRLQVDGSSPVSWSKFPDWDRLCPQEEKLQTQRPMAT